ncbi:hypothetical protein CCY99_01910 [Helicobacter sp. 16-1353]|uniref:hypothetical protein n=1 Tax=Helicobacter sp. 16-1353 TaxID=2004996 RepID=UPI000DCE4BA4|nr:hypothetical protein [Helicobacter sp. 16-1353]RAX54922.1 hypothetical protein CCY99_01910 [Helicobacter sp. 16-1353]
MVNFMLRVRRKLKRMLGNGKNRIRRKVQRLLGIDEVVNAMSAVNNFTLSRDIIKELDIPKVAKEAIFLSMYPSPRGAIQLSYNVENIKRYLDLVRPMCVNPAKLKRIGGEYDGGYVMLTPPPISSQKTL